VRDDRSALSQGHPGILGWLSIELSLLTGWQRTLNFDVKFRIERNVTLAVAYFIFN